MTAPHTTPERETARPTGHSDGGRSTGPPAALGLSLDDLRPVDDAPDGGRR